MKNERVHRKLCLLARGSLVRTSDVDHADWNYRPILGLLQRARFRLAAQFLDNLSGDAILEIGYGSGVFFPHLIQQFKRIYGIDIHPMNEEVRVSVAKVGIDSVLECGSATSMGFEDDLFDGAVAVSSMEYIDEIDDACKEIIRVLKPGGSLVVVTPEQSPLLDVGLKILGGEDAESNYGDRRGKLIDALLRHFSVSEVLRWPKFSPPGLRVYKALLLQAPDHR